MSENIETISAPVPEIPAVAAPPSPTPEEIEAAAKEARIAAEAKAIADYVAKLKTYAGKTFQRKDGKELPTKVIGYAGIRIHQEFVNGKPNAVLSHVFQVESSDGRRWTPPATIFLAEHDEIQVKETKANTLPI